MPPIPKKRKRMANYFINYNGFTYINQLLSTFFIDNNILIDEKCIKMPSEKQSFIRTKLVVSFVAMEMLLLAILVALLCQEPSLVHGDIGTARSYNPPYTPTRCNGNRQDQFPPGNLFVAVSEGLWDNGAACGRRYRLRCLSGAKKPCKGGTIDVKVVDYCTISPCPSTLLLPNDAFQAISHYPNRKINVEYIQI